MYLFDLDGTLTDSNGLWLEVDVAFVGRRGKAVTQEYTDFVSHAIFPTAAAFTQKYYQLEESPQEIMAEWMELAYHQYAHKVPLKPGAREFLSQCRAKGERMALVTAAVPQLCQVALERLEIASYFDFVLYAQELGVEKRDPRFWREALERAGTTGANCTLFDDSPVACRVAKEAGCQVVGVYDPLYASYQEEMTLLCDRYVESFLELV